MVLSYSRYLVQDGGGGRGVGGEKVAVVLACWVVVGVGVGCFTEPS